MIKYTIIVAIPLHCPSNNLNILVTCKLKSKVLPIKRLAFKSYNILLFAGIALAALLFLIPAFYAWPGADDFSYAWLPKLNSYEVLYVNEYFVANGRYFSNAIVLLASYIVPNIFLYRIICIASMLAVFFTNVYLCKKLLFNHSFMTAVLISMVQFNICTSFSELFCWFPGIVVYTLSYVLGAFALIFYNQVFHSKTSIVHLITVILLGIAAIGCNEIAMLLVPLGAILIFIFNWQARKRSLLPYVIVTLYIVSALIVFVAPGNQQRSAYFHHDFSLVESIGTTLIYYFEYGSLWITSIPLIALFVYILVSSNKIPLQNKSNRRLRIQLLIASALLVPAIAILLPVYATGSIGQLRTISLASLIFIWIIVLLAKSIPIHAFMNEANLLFVKKIAAAVLISTIIFTGNARVILEDVVRGRFGLYSLQMNDRQQILAGQNSESDVIVDCINDKPSIIGIPELSADTAFWINKAMACYYDVNSVAAK